MSVSAIAKAPWRVRSCRLIAWVALSLAAAAGHAATFVVNRGIALNAAVASCNRVAESAVTSDAARANACAATA